MYQYNCFLTECIKRSRWEFIKYTYVVSAIVITVPNAAFGNEKEGEVIVTGTYAPMTGLEKDLGVSVIGRDEIDQIGAPTVLDVLRGVPGLMVKQPGGIGGLSEISIRGSESNFVLILLDGVAVNDSNNSRGGGFNFSSIDMSSVERIEVIRGTQTAIYGGNALSGVINIITKRPSESSEVRVQLEVGEKSYYDVSGSIGGRSDEHWASLNISQKDSGEYSANDSYQSNNIYAKYGYEYGVDSGFVAGAGFVDDKRVFLPEQSGGDIYARSNDLESIESEELTGFVSWNHRATDIWVSKVEANVFDRKAVQVSPGILPYESVPPNQSDSDYLKGKFQWTNTVGHLGKSWFNTGIELSDEHGESIGDIAEVIDASYEIERSNLAFFGEYNWNSSSDWFVRLSLRSDEPEGEDNEISSAVTLALPLSEDSRVSVDWGKGFKLPSFFALAHPLVGNPNLTSEEGTTWSLRFYTAHSILGNVEFAYAESQYKDLIDFDPVAFTNINRSKTDIDSIEFSWDKEVGTKLKVNLYATFLDIETHEEGVELLRRPDREAGFAASWTMNPKAVLFLRYQYVGDQLDASLYTGETIVETLESFRVLDLSFTYAQSNNFSYKLSVDNALDEEYQEAIGFSSVGRTFRAQISMNF